MRQIAAGCLILAPLAPPAAEAGNAGIPLCDAGRTGFAAAEIAPPYRLAWTYVDRHAPRPAWTEPAWEPQRIDFDYAYAVAAHGSTSPGRPARRVSWC